MLTIKAEIKKNEQKTDGTYNVKLRFTLNRKVKRLSTSLFVKSMDLTRSGNFKKGTSIYKEIEKLVSGYQQKCDSLQIDLNGYSLEQIFKKLKFEEQRNKHIDFIQFSREWIANATIKGAKNYKSAINSLVAFWGKDELNILDISTIFLRQYVAFLNGQRNIRIQEMLVAGKRIPSNRMISLYLGSLRHLYKEAQRKYNDYENGLILIPTSPFDNITIPKQEATRKRAVSADIIKKVWRLPYKEIKKGYKATCRYNLAKDCFILSFCLMGINSADLYNVTEMNDNTMIYYRTKTKARRLDNAKMMVDVPTMILPLIEKYRDKTGKRLFNFYQYYADERNFNRAINIGLKEIGELVGVEDLGYYSFK